MSNPTRIFFAGDFCSKPSTQHLTLSDELRDKMRMCHLRVCNFEFPLRPEDSKGKNYQNDDAPLFLKNAGFDLFTLANNHTFDCGERGFEKTRDALEGSICGAGTFEEAYHPKIMEINGVKIAFLSLCYAAKNGVFDEFSDKSRLGCAYLNDLSVNHIILRTKKEVDYLIVLPHDGMEYVDIPMPDTIARYRDLIDYGADAVIGTHPHCPQGWETYHGKPIFYSLGNFFFNSKTVVDTHTHKPHWYEGLCVILTLSEQEIGFEILNTLNIGNRTIAIDNSEEREQHNRQICQYLSDKNLYNQYLKEHVFEILKKEDFRILDASVHRKPFHKTLSIWLHRLGHLITGRRHVNDEKMVALLKNDARRKALLQMMDKES